MTTGKNLKNISIAIMILGLIFMVIASIQTDNGNYVMGGVVVVSLGGFLSHYAEKKIQDN